MYDLGEENLTGRSKEDIWRTLKARNVFLNSIGEYKLYVGQKEIQWSDLPVLNATFVSNPFLVPFRGSEFKLSDTHRVPRPRVVGPLTAVTYQLFTMEKEQVGDPVNISVPNEISLSQLVTYFILPAGRDFDVGTTFFWCLKEISRDKGDKTKCELEQIPAKIPESFNLRVKCTSLRSASTKKMEHVKWGAVLMNFAMAPNDTMKRLKERVADWMNQRGQGPQWTIDRPDDEEIEFSSEFEVVPLVRDVLVRIFLKQAELKVSSSMSWINLSDQLVKRWGLPQGSLLQIMPVTGDVDDRDPEDFSYSVTWEKDKQYWYHIVYDPSKDRVGQSKEILMVDEFDRTDTLIVPVNATIDQVRELWSRMLELSRGISMQVLSTNGREYYWSLSSAHPEVSFTFTAKNFRGNGNIFDGSPHFQGEQLSRRLNVKIPPLPFCRISPRRDSGQLIHYDEEVPQLSHKLLKTHKLAWQMNGKIIQAPEATAWWLPYDRNAIMRYGNTVNSIIPPDVDMAEFPDEPWPADVLIRIKAAPSPQALSPPIFVGGPPPSSPPPTSWQGPAIGQAPVISAAAASLSDYSSPNSTQMLPGQKDELPDPSLQVFRGLSEVDEQVHKLISWTTLESYPLRVGISLPVPNQMMIDGEEVAHEAQLWEETNEDLVIERDHAMFVYNWLSNRLRMRSSTGILPERMPESVADVSIQISKNGEFGQILFTPLDSLADSMKDMEVQVVFEYFDGFMRVGMDAAYTLNMLLNEFNYLTRESWLNMLLNESTQRRPLAGE
jgi:hypothetical protein